MFRSVYVIVTHYDRVKDDVTREEIKNLFSKREDRQVGGNRVYVIGKECTYDGGSRADDCFPDFYDKECNIEKHQKEFQENQHPMDAASLQELNNLLCYFWCKRSGSGTTVEWWEGLVELYWT